MYVEHPSGYIIKTELLENDFLNIGETKKDLELFELQELEGVMTSLSKSGKLSHLKIIKYSRTNFLVRVYH